MAGLVDLRRIDVSAPEVLVVTTGQGSEVTFGLDDLERQLRRWREIHDLGQRMNRNVASLDLAVSNNVPVRWLEASLRPRPAKTPKTSRNRKQCLIPLPSLSAWKSAPPRCAPSSAN